MPLSDFIQIAISIDSIGLARAGFGVLLILSANATFPERVRFYSDIAGLAADWAIDSPEYLAGSAALSQGDPAPTAIAIGRTALKPTMKYRLAVATLSDATAYKVRARGQGVTDTTVTATSATPGTFEGTHNALLAAVNGVTGKNFTATFAPLTTFSPQTFTVDNTTDIFTITAHGLFTGDGPFQATNTGGALPSGLLALTDYYIFKLSANTFKLATTRALALAGTPDVNVTTNGTGTQTLSGNTPLSPTAGIDVTGNAVGNWFSLEVLDTNGLSTSLASNYLSNAMTHADPGVATDLNNIVAVNSGFYLVYPLYPSTAYGLGVMAWVESTGTSSTGAKVCIIDTCDTHTITASAGGNDIGDQAKAASYDRTLLEYHPSPIDFLGAALAGAVLPLDPGSETWAFKTLVGPRGVNLSDTQRVNLRARNMNTYEPQTPDLTWTWDGKTPGGEFFDTVRGLDAVRDDAVKSIAEVLANNPKVPYTDGGALQLGNELEGVFARAVTATIFADDPAPKVTIPRVAAQTAANRKARKFAGLKGSATLAGAIQDVGPVSIIVTQ